jgi:glycosyltransferase involved in cell wall biosynthesis
MISPHSLASAPSQVTVIYNGIEHNRFFPEDRAKAKQKAALQYRLERPFFLYVARLEHPGKNHVRLISATLKAYQDVENKFRRKRTFLEILFHFLTRSCCACHISFPEFIGATFVILKFYGKVEV